MYDPLRKVRPPPTDSAPVTLCEGLKRCRTTHCGGRRSAGNLQNLGISDGQQNSASSVWSILGIGLG